MHCFANGEEKADKHQNQMKNMTDYIKTPFKPKTKYSYA